MLGAPFLNEATRPAWKFPCDEFTVVDLNAGFPVAILGVEVRGRVIPKIQSDANTVESAQLWQVDSFANLFLSVGQVSGCEWDSYRPVDDARMASPHVLGVWFTRLQITHKKIGRIV